MNITKIDVPTEIEEVANQTVQSAMESDFFENDIHPDVCEEAKNIMFNLAASILLKRWMNGETLQYTEDEAMDFLHRTIVDSSLYHLFKLGVLDSIEDENGEEVFWVKEEYKNMSALEIEESLNKKLV